MLKVGDVARLQVDTHLVGVLQRLHALGIPLVVETLQGGVREAAGGRPGRGIVDAVLGEESPDSVEVPLLGCHDLRERTSAVVLIGECLVQVAGESLLLAAEDEAGDFGVAQLAVIGEGHRQGSQTERRDARHGKGGDSSGGLHGVVLRVPKGWGSSRYNK